MSILDCTVSTPKCPIYVRVWRRRRVFMSSNVIMIQDTSMMNAIRQ